MSLAPLIPDPALAEDEWPFEGHAPGSMEDMLDKAVWLVRMSEALRAADEAVRDEVERINASYRATKAMRGPDFLEPPRRYPDTMQGALQADDDRRQELNQDEWEFGR